jgi:hypothetical protein
VNDLAGWTRPVGAGDRRNDDGPEDHDGDYEGDRVWNERVTCVHADYINRVVINIIS